MTENCSEWLSGKKETGTLLTDARPILKSIKTPFKFEPVVVRGYFAVFVYFDPKDVRIPTNKSNQRIGVSLLTSHVIEEA